MRAYLQTLKIFMSGSDQPIKSWARVSTGAPNRDPNTQQQFGALLALHASVFIFFSCLWTPWFNTQFFKALS